MSGTIVMHLSEAPNTGEGGDAVTVVWPDLEARATRMAQRLTPDADRQEEMLHQAMIKLWKADATRYDFGHPGDVSFIWRLLYHLMCDVRGRLAFKAPVTAAEVLGPEAVRAIRAELKSCE